MPQWEYMTLIVRQNNDKIMNVTHVNSKEAASETSGMLIKSKTYQYDLPSYLAKIGREGWEMVGLAPTTNYGAGSIAGEGANDVLIILKRPLGQ